MDLSSIEALERQWHAGVIQLSYALLYASAGATDFDHAVHGFIC
jgi:hypothetical protein